MAVRSRFAPAQALERVSLRLDWLRTTHHAPFFLGVERGWYREAGIDLELREGRGSGNVVQLVASGGDDFGFAGADAVVRGVATGAQVLAVATLMPRNADAVFAPVATGIRRPADLAGRRIASTAGGTSDTLLPAFLRSAGVDPARVTIVRVDPSLKVQVTLQGQVDAMNGPVWSGSLFRPVGGATMMRYADHGVVVVGYTIVASAAALRDRPELVGRMVAATLRSWRHAAERPVDALEALQRAVEPLRSVDRAALLDDLVQMLALVRPASAGEILGRSDAADWRATAAQLVEYGAAREARPVEQYFSNRFVR